MNLFQEEKLTDQFNFNLPSYLVSTFNTFLYLEIITLNKHIANAKTYGRDVELAPPRYANITKLSDSLKRAYNDTWCKHSDIATITLDKLTVTLVDGSLLRHLLAPVPPDTG